MGGGHDNLKYDTSGFFWKFPLFVLSFVLILGTILGTLWLLF